MQKQPLDHLRSILEGCLHSYDARQKTTSAQQRRQSEAVLQVELQLASVSVSVSAC